MMVSSFGAVVTLLLCDTFTGGLALDDVITYDVNIDTTRVISQTEEEYLSSTLGLSTVGDGNIKFNFSHPRVHTLARGLAPAVIRFGGGSADVGIFYNEATLSKQKAILDVNKVAVDSDPPFGGITAIFPQSVDDLILLARSAQGRLLYDLNIELRFGAQWDSSNARELMQFISDKGYSDIVDFELGNEPHYNKFGKKAFDATGHRVGKDFLILRRVLDKFPQFNNSRLVGPDVETPRDGTYIGPQPIFMRDFAHTVLHNLSAITVHHYYFQGPPATIEQFYNLTFFKYLESTLPLLRNTVYKASGGPVDIWIGETSDSNQGGTPGITDSFASGFLWLDKLGIAAQNQIKLVARQTFYSNSYALVSKSLDPRPDYWLSHVYKKLVGRSVLQTNVTSLYNNGLLRAYAHCVSPRSGYTSGSVVLYAININVNKSAMLKLPVEFTNNYEFDLYLMTPKNNNLTSPDLDLNGKTMRLVDDYTLPTLNPVSISPSQLKMPPLSYGFLVLRPKNNSNPKFSIC